jgi:hypothetical protein
MSRSKRSPIDYTPQFAEGVFRPKDVVEGELAQASESPPGEHPTNTPSQPTKRPSRSVQPTAPVIEVLYRSLQQRQLLAQSTFRFQPEELKELDAVLAEVQQAAPGKFSKNDLVRLALNSLLSDYRRNGEQSTLGKVVERT